MSQRNDSSTTNDGGIEQHEDGGESSTNHSHEVNVRIGPDGRLVDKPIDWGSSPTTPKSPPPTPTTPSKIPSPDKNGGAAVENDDGGNTTSSSDEESDFEEYEQCDCVDEPEIIPDRIPYSAIYDSQDEVHKRGYFNPSLPVDARIVNVERDTSGTIHLINPYIYTIELEHGKYTWTVFRRYIDFQLLHNRLLLFRAASKVAAPMRRLEATLAYDHDKQLVEGETQAPTGTITTAARRRRTTSDGENIPMETLRHRSKELKPQHQRQQSADVAKPIVADDKPPTPSAVEELSLKNDQGTTTAAASRIQQGQCPRHQRMRKRRPCKLPHFPMLPDSVISQDRLEERKLELQRYISAVLHIYAYRNHHETAEFLEVSRLSFVHNLGAKMKEGFVKKRPGGNRQFHGIKRFCITNCAKWSVRWLVIKDSFVSYMHPRNEQIRHVLLFDADFHVRAGPGETDGMKRGLLLSNMQRDLLLKCQSEEEAELWKRAIQDTIQGVGKIWLDTHRFGATYPVRENSYAQWFVDGGPYMEHVANMMELAREEIFITGWWLSPEIYMKRPMTEGDRWRLDEILKRKAQQGVRVFILLYKEVTMALGISSYYSKKRLMDKHPNIKVLRHPDHMPGTGVLLWAHHEKIVVIDQNIAFVGGIDLCYGRWDDHRHRLSDMGSVQYQAEHLVHLQPKSFASGLKSITQMFGTLTSMDIAGIPLADAEAIAQQNGTAASEVVSSIEPGDAEAGGGKDEIDSPTPVPVTQGEAIAGGNALVAAAATGDNNKAAAPVEGERKGGRAARLWSRAAGVAPHPSKLLRRGLSHQSQLRTPSVPAVAPVPVQKERRSSTGGEGSPKEGKKTDMADVVRKYRQLVESGVIQAEKSRGTPPMKRKRNKVAKYLHDWREAHARRKREEQEEPVFSHDYEAAWKKLQDEAQVDLGLTGGGKLWMGKDYVNFIHKDFTDLDMPFHDFIDRAITPRMPWHDIASAVYGSAARDVARHFIQRWNACKMEKVKDDDGFPFLMPKSYDNVRVPRVFRSMATPCTVQIVRSVGLWSAGMNATEESIHQAYLHMIRDAEHFIYIENQFFISQIGGGEIHNRIAQALLERIVRAHKNNETFRVYILMPLLPGFEGQLGTTGASALQVVLHWTYVSISKGPFSLLTALEAEIGDPSRYISFCSLRTHGELVGRVVSELLYIHSKMILVDDRKCLIGSANINDRSQLGKRDSEVGIYVEDTEFTQSTMNGQPFQVGKFCGDLRRNLFREHLGLSESSGDSKWIDIEDIASEKFFNQWKQIAAENEEIYEKVFACIPCDQVQTFEELQRYQHQIPLCEYNIGAATEMLRKLRGRLVAFPTKFLLQSNLTPSIASKEGLAPAYLFT